MIRMWDMIIKQRSEPLEFILFRYINARMVLSDKEIRYYLNLKKGFEGEQKSDVWLENLTDEWLILHDLLLEYNHSKFQIDTLIIAYEKVYILDVKNYEGDYYIEGDKWYTQSKTEQRNPLHQLNRCETLLRKLLLNLGYHYSIESYLIFINPEFHLYQPTINPTIIFPAQLYRFLKKLNLSPVKLNKRHIQLAEQLVSLHIIESPYTFLPDYNYGQLKKAINCSQCYSFFTEFTGETLVCSQCGCKEDVESAILRSVKEFKLLFPDRKITTNGIYDWCGGVKSKKTIRRILSKHYKLVGHGKSSNYV